MGAAKPLAPLGGRPLIAWPLAAAAAAGLRAVVVAKAATPLPPVDVEVWQEPDEPQHPLTGLVLRWSAPAAPVVAVGCDQPWLTPELLASLAAAAGCAAPLVRGAFEPFPARYRPRRSTRCAPPATRRRRVRRVLAALSPESSRGATPRVVAGVNTPEALAAAERRERRARTNRRAMTAEDWIADFAAALGRPAPTRRDGRDPARSPRSPRTPPSAARRRSPAGSPRAPGARSTRRWRGRGARGG